MPRGLKRYQEGRDLHFITFSCYRRQPLLASPPAMHRFELALEQSRVRYGFYVVGYVVMPEHVHLLISEPERGTLASAIQAIKQSVSRRLMGDHQHFWQARYYDFNVWTKRKRVEKLCYLHRNPVKRGLVEKPEDWPWSSFRHYLTGEESAVEVESPWTDRKRERMGTTPRVKVVEPAGWGGQLPRLSQKKARTGHPR
jgi:putative transposase